MKTSGPFEMRLQLRHGLLSGKFDLYSHLNKCQPWARRQCEFCVGGVLKTNRGLCSARRREYDLVAIAAAVL